LPHYYNLLETNEFVVLHEVSNLLTSTLHFENTIKQMFELLHKKLGFMKGILTVVDHVTLNVLNRITYGITDQEKEIGIFEKWEEITEKVLESRGPMIIPHIDESQDILGINDVHSLKDESFICIPLMVGSDIFGTLSVDFLYKNETNLQFIIKLLGLISLIIAQELKLKKLMDTEKESLRKENLELKQELSDKFDIHNMIGKSKAMKDVYKSIKQVASSNATVLIRGESGTGKELVAHAIHYQSSRAKKPFIRINCAAIPETLLESELFGHQKGAFTDAFETKIGKVEAAHGGTIFLDEIGELPTQMQVKLLRFLQEREISRVGSVDVISVDVRLIAATNIDVEKQVELKTIREDFYYRLNVFPIHLPPLRERNLDILLLTEHFLEKYSKENNKQISKISSSVSDLLRGYSWPGNVRELENCIERSVILCSGEMLHPEHLPSSINLGESKNLDESYSLKDKVSIYEKEIIVNTLAQVNGNVSKAARILNTTHRILSYKISSFMIDVSQFKLA
jgi:Nif-specific regulatory protein